MQGVPRRVACLFPHFSTYLPAQPSPSLLASIELHIPLSFQNSRLLSIPPPFPFPHKQKTRENDKAADATRSPLVHLQARELLPVAVRVPFLDPFPWAELAHVKTRQEAFALVLLVLLQA